MKAEVFVVPRECIVFSNIVEQISFFGLSVNELVNILSFYIITAIIIKHSNDVVWQSKFKMSAEGIIIEVMHEADRPGAASELHD